MSHLSTPRIHFQGEFITNIPTANNDNVVRTVDAANVRVNTQGMSDADFQQWLIGLTPQGIRAGWNYFGNADCRFQNVRVTGVETAGQLVQDAAVEPLVNGTVELRQAIMVDVDPEGALGSQIFCDNFRLSDGEGIVLQGPATRAYSRWIHFGRNLSVGGFSGAAAVWQTTILPEKLEWGTDRPNSPVLQALRAATSAGEGITIRFCTYLVAPAIASAQLAGQFAAGQRTQNAARGIVVGSIGRWLPGEMSSVTLARLLHPVARTSPQPAISQLGPALAQVDRARKVIVLDLITTFPEADVTRAKINIGEVLLGVQAPPPNSNQFIPLGPLAYDQATYEQRGGTLEIPYAEAQEALILANPLLLVHSASGFMPLLAERNTVVETDERGIYLQENEEQTLQVRVAQLGEPAPAGVLLHLEQLVAPNDQAPPAPVAQPILGIPPSVTVGAGGLAQIPVKALRAGNCLLRIFVDQEDAPQSFDAQLSFFSNVRILPADSYDHIADADLNFPLIYNEVLRYYYLLYPAMNDQIDLSVEGDVTSSAGEVLRRIDKTKWHLRMYMPRTRDLSDGKRKLLARWCAKVGVP